MLKTDKLGYKIMLIINLVFAAACAVGAIYVVVNPGKDSAAIMPASDLCALIAIFAALYYIFLGYRKNAARYFKFFSIALSAAALFAAIGVGMHGDGLNNIVCYAAVCIFALILTVTRNFGKTASVICCVLSVAFALIGLVFVLTGQMSGITAGEAYAVACLIRGVTYVVLAALFLLLTLAKYMDKVERGRPTEED